MNDNPFSDPILTKTANDTIKASDDALFAEPILHSIQEVSAPVLHTQRRDLGYSSSAWFIGVLVLLLIIFSKIRISYSKLTSDMFTGFFRYRYILKIYDTKNSSNNIGYFLMNMLFLISVPLFLFQVGIFKGYIPNGDYKILLFLIGAVMAFFAFKIMITHFIAAVFKGTKEANEYIFNLLMHFKVAGMIIFPLTICIPYIFSSVVPTVSGIGFLVLGLAYLSGIFRGIKILYLKHVSVFYMILYLCALEIVPALILLKFSVIK